MKKLRDNSFITALGLFPFILLLSILYLTKVLKNNLYGYLILMMVIIFIFAFIFSLFFALDEIISSNKKKRIVLLMLFPFIYLPVYYTKYIYKDERYIGYGTAIANIFFSIVFLIVLNNVVVDYVVKMERKNFVVKNTYSYVEKKGAFSIIIDNDYVCNKELGDYAIACDNTKDDSFLGVYSYTKDEFSAGELDDINDYHLEQVIESIKEKNYEYNIEKVYGGITKVNYNDMCILVKQVSYHYKDKSYCLVFVKEVLEEKLDIFAFEKSVQSVSFLG